MELWAAGEPNLKHTNTLIPDIQESTHQVPCGPYSIFEDAKVSEFERAVYLCVNERSYWDTGISHALSYTKLAKRLNVKHRSQVVRAIKSLIKKGWLKVEAQRKSDKANIYRITHHNCPPDKVPLDKDNRPLKCAVPYGKGSATYLVAEGKLDWRAMVQWFVSKIKSDWITGVVQMTVRKAGKLLNFSLKTICKNANILCEIGLFKRLSAKNHASEYQIYPQPYPERRERKERETAKPLPQIGNWYYSYNKLWRFHRNSLQLQMSELDGKWRDASMNELYNINPNIHADFNDYINHLAILRSSFNSNSRARC